MQPGHFCFALYEACHRPDQFHQLAFFRYLDEYLPEHDFEGKSPDKLNFGRDYVHDDPESNKKEDGGDFPKKEPGLYGLPDGMEEEELDADKTISPRHQDYGTTNSGNTLYNKNNLTGS